MADDMQKLFDLVEDVRRNADVNAVFGEPLTTDGRTIIPVAEVLYGVGLGFGTAGAVEGEEQPGGSGSGGVVRARPLGVIEVTAEGVRVEPVLDEQKIVVAGVLLTAWIAAWIAGTVAFILGQSRRNEQ